MPKFQNNEWIGEPPNHCDVCGEPINNVFVDGLLKTGCWANMCLKCFHDYGTELGEGKGQEWWLDPGTGRFVEI